MKKFKRLADFIPIILGFAMISLMTYIGVTLIIYG